MGILGLAQDVEVGSAMSPTSSHFPATSEQLLCDDVVSRAIFSLGPGLPKDSPKTSKCVCECGLQGFCLGRCLLELGTICKLHRRRRQEVSCVMYGCMQHAMFISWSEHINSDSAIVRTLSSAHARDVACLSSLGLDG